MKILVVEDSPSMRSFLAAMIEEDSEAAFEIVEAASGFEALKMLPHFEFSAILTDINMPDINGLELVSFLKAHPVYKRIPVLVISTEGSAEDQRRAAQLGAEGYLVKPFSAAALSRELRKILPARR